MKNVKNLQSIFYIRKGGIMRKKMVAAAALIVFLGTTAFVALADAPTPLGGLDLLGYCQSQGYAGVTLTKPLLGPNAAFDNWRCVTFDGRTHPFSMEQACKWQYGLKQVQAHPSDPDDATTWVCYSVAH